MKKKRFIKLAGATTLAALAGLSLVACGGDDKDTVYTVKLNSNDPDTSDNISVTTYDDMEVKEGSTINLPTLTYEGYTFGGWYSDVNFNNEFTKNTKVESDLTLYAKWTKNGEPAPTPTTTYTITFDANGHGTAPQSVSGVTAIPQRLPSLEADGYRFIGWGTSASATTAVAAGTAITENTTLYAIWEQLSLYEIYAASQGKVYATQFEEAIVAPSITTYDGESQGVFSVSDQTNELKVEVTGGKLAVTDASTTKPAEARIEIGYLYSGVLEGTLTHKFTKSASKQDLISFYGSADLASETKLFALKTDTNKKVNVLLAGPKKDPDDSSKNWGDLQTHYVGTPVTFVENEEVNIYYKYEFETGKLTIKYNNQAVLTDYVLPLTTTYGTTQMAIRPLFITGFGFITGGTATDRAVYVDDFALINTGKGDLAATKTYMISRLDSLYQFLDVEHKYTINGANITALYNGVKEGINAATSANDAADAFMAFAAYKAIKSDEDVAEELEAYKKTQKETISTYKTTLDINNNYSVNKTAVEAIFTDADTAIDAATSKSAVDAIVTGVSTSVAAIKSDATLRAEAVSELAQYKESKLTEIASDIAQDKQADCIAAVNTAYETQITSLNNCAMTDLNTTLAAAKTALDNVVNSYKKTIAELQAELDANLQAYKATKITPYSTTDEIENALIQAVNAITLDWTNKDTIDLCNAEYDARVAEIDALVATHVAKVQAKANLDNYVTTALGELKLVQEDEYDTSEYKNEVDSLVATQKSNIQNATDIASALTAAEGAVDAKILQIKAATEITVTFVNGTETVDTQVVLKGHTATASTVVPTKTGYAFKAWYADENQETAFNFTTTINSATTIYAGWYDTYGEISQSGMTTTYMDSLENVKPIATARQVSVDSGNYIEYLGNNSSDEIKLDADNNDKKAIWFNGGSKSSRYIKIVVDKETKLTVTYRYTGTSKSCWFGNTLTSTAPAANIENQVYGLSNNGSEKNVYNVEKSLTVTVPAGTWYFNSTDKLYIYSLVMEVNNLTAVTGITATATAGEDSISISDVKLQPVSGAAFAITEGYTVTVKDSNNNIVSDYSQNLAAGIYTVTVKYGTYTVSIPYEVEIEAAVPPVYATITYAWDGNKCTATQECINYPDLTVTETVEAIVVNVAQASVGHNRLDRYLAEFTNAIFTTQVSESFEVPNTALEPEYADPTYVWNGNECTATQVCTNDASYTITDTVTGAVETVTVASVGHNRVDRYVATFVFAGFTTQYSEPFEVPNTALEPEYAAPTYVWDEDHKCTATRVCTNDSTYTETETVTGVFTEVTPAGIGKEQTAKYLATFTNELFATQESDTFEVSGTMITVVTTEAELEEAVAINLFGFKLGNDITLTKNITISASVSINLDNHTINAGNYRLAAYNDSSTIKVAISNGTIEGNSHVLRANLNSEVTVSDLTVNTTGTGIASTAGTLIINTATINGACAVAAYEGANVEIKNGAFTSTDSTILAESNSTITIKDGVYTASKKVVIAQDGSTITIKDGQFQSTADVAMATVASTLIIDGGTVNAQEAAVMAFDAGTVEISGGTFTTVDNFVVGTNGTEGSGANSITINGGEFNGNITSSGYVACGVYVANNDTVIINSGTFNIINGVGVLARSGNTTIEPDAVFNVSGTNILGKVGDSKITVPSGSIIVIDYAANYPGGEPTVTNNTDEAAYILVDDEDSFATAINTVGSYIVLNNDITLTKNISATINGTVTVICGEYGIIPTNEEKIIIGKDTVAICDAFDAGDLLSYEGEGTIASTQATETLWRFFVEVSE